MDDGCYIVKNGEVYKVDLPVGIKPTKTVNIITGEIHYPTNYDKITHMSVEELAAFLLDIDIKANNYGYEAADGEPGEYPLPEDWLAWLKQGVSE